MNSTTRVLLTLAVSVLTACAADPISRHSSDNSQIQVDKLLTIEGCTVYRFHDESYRYVTICPDARRTSTNGDFTTSNGKQTFRHPNTIDVVRNP